MSVCKRHALVQRSRSIISAVFPVLINETIVKEHGFINSADVRSSAKKLCYALNQLIRDGKGPFVISALSPFLEASVYVNGTGFLSGADEITIASVWITHTILGRRLLNPVCMLDSLHGVPCNVHKMILTYLSIDPVAHC